MRRLRIGISARFGYGDAKLRGGLRGNYYVEQSFAGWIQTGGGLSF